MKKVIIVVFTIITNYLNAQNIDSSGFSGINSKFYFRITENDSNSYMEFYDEFITNCIDSLYKIDSNNILPFWLTDSCYDYNQFLVAQTAHLYISYRKEIISKIKDLDIINFLIRKYEKQLKCKCNKKILNTIVLFSKFSSYDLLLYRYYELKQKR